MLSFAPEVTTNNDPKWYGNALRFATEEEARQNAFDLSMRWMAVTDYRAVPSPDPVNYSYVGRTLRSLEA